MLSVYEFRDAGSIGTGTTMIGTGTNPFLSMGIGTTLLLSHGYRYHPCLVPAPNCDSTEETADFAISHSLFFNQPLNSIQRQEDSPWNLTKT